MFYREGMQGSILFSGVAMVIYFVVGIKYENVMLMDTPTSVGKYVVLLLAQIFTTGMVASYCKSPKTVRIMAIAVASTTLIATLAARFIVAFDIVWIQLATIVAMAIFLIYQGFPPASAASSTSRCSVSARCFSSTLPTICSTM